ncbi:carboxylesterase, putative [Cordyceps militaris CM01]|uniref:Carboxylic ester hydrolase n=1 Tax=Cordyceps militaris (strain CM01) TaxID=983644 RepID=G3JCG9_CORMM|nr:carboxylesterase, putative [Cordyceps militaris CM01]EGX94630.1 carboxylesterase, putative [Cordyceps militaris CM01]
MQFIATSLLALAGAVTAEVVLGDGADPRSFLTVNTTNGLVTGHAASNSQSVIEYLGIPYAKPPVGELRFAIPVRFRDNKPYEAAYFGHDCPLTSSPPVDYPGFTPQAPRILSYFASGASANKSEDCLTLNIWAKTTPASLKRRKPVIVFFYGGRFAIGNTNSPFYNAKYFADAQDAIFITVNYRVNIFGFPGFPGKPQNAGLRDQRAAVEWLHENIYAFGGDANKMTISGQSSGGVSVDYWTYAYQDRPLVNGVIATSGNAFSFPVQPKGVPLESFKQVAKQLGCCSTRNVYECVKKADWQKVEAAAAAVKPGKSSSPLRSVPPFYPIPDEEIVFSDYVHRTNAGQFARIPLFSGNNHNEAGYYKIPAYSNGVVPTQAQVDSFHLESFTCPIAHQANARKKHGVPAWVWRYLGDWDNTRLYPTSGAYHGSDLHMVYGASGDVSGIQPAVDQQKLTEVMQRAWYAFSNDPWHGLTDAMGWPQYDEQNASLVVYGKDNSPELTLVKPSEFNAPCSTITLGALSLQTSAGGYIV